MHSLPRRLRSLRWPTLCGWAAFLLLGVMATACSEQYNITGDSTVSALDGRMLYLKVPTHDFAMRDIDSCEVIHGKFNFMGMIDSIVMGEIFMDNEGVMPIVVENGNVSIVIKNTEQRVIGGSLNSRLYRFLDERTRIEEAIMNLQREEADRILFSANPIIAHRQLQEKMRKLHEELETLETKFVYTNSGNVLGPSYFIHICEQYPYPVITPQIERIIKKANRAFSDQPFVSEYLRAARANMKHIQDGHPYYQTVTTRCIIH